MNMFISIWHTYIFFNIFILIFIQIINEEHFISHLLHFIHIISIWNRNTDFKRNSISWNSKLWIYFWFMNGFLFFCSVLQNEFIISYLILHNSFILNMMMSFISYDFKKDKAKIKWINIYVFKFLNICSLAQLPI